MPTVRGVTPLIVGEITPRSRVHDDFRETDRLTEKGLVKSMTNGRIVLSFTTAICQRCIPNESGAMADSTHFSRRSIVAQTKLVIHLTK